MQTNMTAKGTLTGYLLGAFKDFLVHHVSHIISLENTDHNRENHEKLLYQRATVEESLQRWR